MSSVQMSVEREQRTAIVHLQGDLVVPTAGDAYGRLRALARRRDVGKLVLDFSGAERVDSAGVALISLVRQQLERHGKELELRELNESHRAAIELMPRDVPDPPTEPAPGRFERLGEYLLVAADNARDLAKLVAQTARQTLAVAVRRRRMPSGALSTQVATMGVDAVFIVGLLSFLLGMTLAFQGSVQLRRFGAGVFVADMIGMSMVRELAPLMTAIILSGRTGAAIAAELGTMKVRSEIDAMQTMGIDPVRFLVVPRLLAITLVVPALTLMAIFIGGLGGMLVANLTLDLPPGLFWARVVERVQFGDFAHGIGKSFVFAWIIGLAGSHLGMRARGDASSVGAATTRTVVVSIFFIIVVDAVFATISTFMRMR